MAATSYEVKGTNSGSRSLQNGDVVVRKFKVDADDDSTYQTPLAASYYPTIPRLGDEYSDPNSMQQMPLLICQSVNYEYAPDSKFVTEVTCTYSERSGSLRPNLASRRWSIGTRLVRQYVDLDGETIGFPQFTEIIEGGTPVDLPRSDERWQDRDAVMGTDVLVPEVYLDISFPRNHSGRLPLGVPPQVIARINDVGVVHNGSAPFQGHAAGTIQYIGVEAVEVGPNQNQFEWTHHYRIGALQLVGLEPSPLEVDLAHTFVWSFKSVDGQRDADQVFLRRIYPYADLNTMFPHE